jgi:Arc/MetJ-type ribon-helix-helix transcriptional regulator
MLRNLHHFASVNDLKPSEVVRFAVRRFLSEQTHDQEQTAAMRDAASATVADALGQ